MKYLVCETLFVLVLYAVRSYPAKAIAPQLSVGQVTDLTYHRLVKRQTPSSQDTQDLIDCSTIILDYQCGSSGYAQGIANIAQGCGNDSYARNVASACARNENGFLCGTATLRLSLDESLVAGVGECDSAVALGSCPAACRRFLQYASTILGCCINTYINNTDSTVLSVNSTYVDYRLWNLCNVPLPADDCGNALPLNPPPDAQDQCTTQEFITRVINYECMASVSQPLVDTLLQSSRCYEFARAAVDSCSVNANGEYCAIVIGSDAITSSDSSELLLESLLTSCDSSSSTSCSSSCRSAVTTIANGYGCCVSVLNDTISKIPQLSYSVWNSCGLETPGVCATSTLSSAATMKTFAWMITIAIICVMALHLYMY